jgi:hypothetical protein
MTKERKRQAVILLEEFKREIVKKQGKSLWNKDIKLYRQLQDDYAVLDDLQELLINGEDE